MMPSIAVDTSKARYNGGLARALQVKGRGREALNESLKAYGEPQIASRKRALDEFRAKTQPRFRIGDGRGKFLSLDGQSVVDTPKGSWFGRREQAENAIARFASAQGMRPLPVIRSQAAGLRDAARAVWGA